MCHIIHYEDRDKTELCEESRLGRKCTKTEEWVKPSRKHGLSRLDLSKIETAASIADRLPTPYAHLPPTPRLSKSPQRDGPGVYVNGTKVAELPKPRKHRDTRDDYDDYHYHRRSSRYIDSDPRERDDERRDRNRDRERRTRLDEHEYTSKLKRSSTLPQYVVIEQEKPRRRSRDEFDGPVDLAKEYIRRRRSSRSRERERERSHERDASPGRGLYYRKHTADGYIVVNDDKERRQQRRERRRSVDEYTPDPGVYSSTAALRYTPRRAATIIHRSDGTTLETKPSPKAKQLRWEDHEVRVRELQNAKIASRPKQRSDPDRDPRLKGILKHAEPKSKHRDDRDEVDELRRAVENMHIPERDIPRGRDRKPQAWDEQMERLRTRLGDDDRGDRRKRSKVWTDDRW